MKLVDRELTIRHYYFQDVALARLGI